MKAHLCENAEKENALMTAAQVRESQPIIAPQVRAGLVKVMAGYYDLDAGQVTFLE